MNLAPRSAPALTTYGFSNPISQSWESALSDVIGVLRIQYRYCFSNIRFHPVVYLTSNVSMFSLWIDNHIKEIFEMITTNIYRRGRFVGREPLYVPKRM